LRGRHLGFSIGIAERDAWMQCMDTALAQVACEPQVRDHVREAMLKLADWMRNQPNNQ
jgi:hemoglobin